MVRIALIIYAVRFHSVFTWRSSGAYVSSRFGIREDHEDVSFIRLNGDEGTEDRDCGRGGIPEWFARLPSERAALKGQS